MPIVVVFDFPGEDTAKYHKVFELGGPVVNAQPSRLDHHGEHHSGCWQFIACVP